MIHRSRWLALPLALITCLFVAAARPQQIADPAFRPAIEHPAYAPGHGPFVLIDEAHFNLHTAGGRFQTFADLLRRDGYKVNPAATVFTKQILNDARILVIADALAARNASEGEDNWSLPTPSAFTDREIEAVRRWVKKGGALFLIADHMPFPGGAEKLAAAFGVKFSNGFARDPKTPGGTITFRRGDGSLGDNAISRGRTAAETINEVATFTGSAFEAGKGAQPLLVFGPSVVSLTPRVAWDFRFDTPRVSVAGWAQGAVKRFGKGRVAVFGDATMFAAQLRGPERLRLGMNDPAAPQNAQFLLNIVHWLSGLLGE